MCSYEPYRQNDAQKLEVAHNISVAQQEASYVPELNASYQYPGITRCEESCGSVGCGCLLPMPGCLYSRTYAEPIDEDLYRVFSCPSWSERIHLVAQLNHINGNRIKRKIVIQPQKTVQFSNMNITLDFVTTPVIPMLSQRFVQSTTGGNTTSMVTRTDDVFAVKCATAEIAKNLTRCRVMETCICTSNDVSKECLCSNVNITERLLSIDSRLPLHNSEFEMQSLKNNIEVASHNSVAEISLSTNVKWKTASVVVPGDCKVIASRPKGCYNCIHGAKLNFTCSSDVRTIAEVMCTDHHYAVSCGPKPVTTTVVVNANSPHYTAQCTVQCGKEKHELQISGLLYYHSLWKGAPNINENEISNYVDLINVPDLSNILDVFGNWWSTSLIAAAALAVAVAITVLCAPLFVQRCLSSCTTTRK